jgi:hypothetical protein
LIYIGKLYRTFVLESMCGFERNVGGKGET